MTVELAVAMPVLIVVAVIAVNAVTFFGACAVFDRAAHEAVRTFATSPAYGQGLDQSCALIEQTVSEAVGASNVEVEVSCGNAESDFVRFTSTLVFHPTLFGLGLRSEVFGVALPPLEHSTSYVVDVYKPGVVI